MPDVALSLLDRVRIASPCTARWADMAGDDKVRHCAQCNLKVHNFSAMAREEAEALLARHFADDGTTTGGRVCGGWYRRPDGTAILADCPVGLARLKAQARRFVAGAAALSGLTVLAGLVASYAAKTDEMAGGYRLRARAFAPFAMISEWLRPTPSPTFLGGVVAMPPSPSPSPLPANAGSGPGLTPSGGTTDQAL